MVGGEYEMDRESWEYEFGLKDFKSWIEGLNQSKMIVKRKF